MLEDRGHGDLGRVDDRVNTKRGDKRDKAGNIDQRHGMRRAVSLGQQSGQDIHLVIICDGNECFGRADIGFGQNAAVEGIAVEDACLSQVFGKEMGARCVALDQLDLGVLEIGLDFGRQHLADGAATGDENGSRLMLLMGKGRHGPVQMLGITDEINAVTRLHHLGTIARQGQFAVANNGKDGHRQVRKQIRQMPDGRVDDRADLAALHTDKVHPAAAHILHVERPRDAQLVADGGGHLCLRRDDMVDGKLVRRIEVAIDRVQIGLVPDTRDLYRCVENGVRHLAGHHIYLIRLGDRDQQFGIPGASLGKNVRI